MWFAITKGEQQQRFADRANDPLRQWKLGPIDKDAQRRWSSFTKYATAMLHQTSHPQAPWTIIRTDHKKYARLESIRHVLAMADSSSKRGELPDQAIVVPVIAGQDFGTV